MKGKDFSEELKETVEYASAESVVLDYSETYGSVRIKQFDGKIKVTDVYEIEFTENADYAFVKWQLYDKSSKKFLTDEEAAKIIKFSQADNPATEFTVLSLQKDLVIYPKCNKRPKISSYSPQYEPKGTYKNQQIVVNFDTPMDEDSIYFSKDELEFVAYDEVFHSNYAGKEDKIYAYMDSNGDIYFKNITITLLNETQFREANSNLAECFEEPYFDASKRVLHYKTNIFYIIDAGSKILVTVNKNMFTTVDGKKVTLTEDKTWDYYTNGLVRQSGPEFANFDISASATKYTGETKDLTELKETSNFSNIKYDTNLLTDIVYGNLIDKDEGIINFYLKSLIFDEDYDIKELSLVFSPLEHSYYEDSFKDQDGLRYTINSTDYSKYPNGAYIDNIASGKPVKIPVADLKEGVYSIYLEAVNENGASGKSESFVFLYDEKPAEITVNDERITYNGAAAWKMRTENYYEFYLNYTINKDRTIRKIEVEYLYLPEATVIDGYSFDSFSENSQLKVMKTAFAEDDYEREYLTKELEYYRKSAPYTPNLLFRYKVTDIYGHIWYSDFVYVLPTDSNTDPVTDEFVGEIHYLQEKDGILEEYYNRKKTQYTN